MTDISLRVLNVQLKVFTFLKQMSFKLTFVNYVSMFTNFIVKSRSVMIKFAYANFRT